MTHSMSQVQTFLTSNLYSVIHSKPFVPFQLSQHESAAAAGGEASLSLAALAAAQHQRHATLLTLSKNATLSDALYMFSTYNITCLPLIDDEGNGTDSARSSNTSSPTPRPSLHASSSKALQPSKIIGMLSCSDALKAVLENPIWNSKVVQDALSNSNTADAITENTALKSELEKLALWSQPAVTFASCTAANRSRWMFTSDQLVMDAITSLSTGLRHVLVCEVQAPVKSKQSSGSLSEPKAWVHIVSQGDIFRHIYTFIKDIAVPEALQVLYSDPISSHLTTTQVISVLKQERTLRAFQALFSSSSSSYVGAIPVLNNTGMCIETLSGTDFRYITPQSAYQLLMPVDEFLSVVHPKVEGRHSKSLRPAFSMSVPMHAEFSMALEKIVTSGISRIWVVDDYAKPVGCVAQSDLMRWIMKAMGAPQSA